ncbi:hypothetical protein SI65_09764 [Aspergillus cristatus]|uniref:Uncharacterized protein n=1 Tax=Aspergillus cristatus TaxID=573508 RepID=A0A1E3B1D9_ASPCR|nr:hypothetical protein SI65_09764 [Aspergillus cristatus]
MAASFGEKLLGEVTEARLDEILHDLRNICPDESSNCLGVKALDDLLEIFMPVPAPAPQHPDENSNLQPEDRQAHQAVRAHPDPVVEISSTSSVAGKSQLLYYLAAIAVLPSTIDNVQIDGRNAAVVFIDTDGRFDADRLLSVVRGILYQKLKQHMVEQLPDTESILYNSLQHVHVFRPTSSSSLLATLQSLESYLFDTGRHLSANRPLHAIFIDSATAFFWQDKLRDQIARVEEIGRPHSEIEHDRRSKRSFYIGDMYAELVRELKRVRSLFGCAVVYTTTAWVGRAASASASGEDLVAFRCSLPPPWGLFPTLRVVVRANGQGRFLGCVNGLGREEWPRRVVEELERQSRGTFVFSADEHGVLV